MKQKWKGSTLLAPVPSVIVSCGSMENANLITIGWTGIINSHPPKLYISVRPERFSYDIIKNSGEFCVNIPTAEMAKAVDYCGVKSGRECDKYADCKLTKSQSFEVSCPSIEECPIVLECKTSDIIHLGTHDMFIADIIAVAVDDSLVDHKGRLMLEKADLMTYAHGDYFTVGKKIGDFGFSVRKKKNLKRNRK